MKLLVTGGAGFIGSAFVRLVHKLHPDWKVTNLDLLTYAGNLDNLTSVAENPNYSFVRGDIADMPFVEKLMSESRPDVVVHFAAESHVDRSILSPEPVIRTNFNGTFSLLESARRTGIAKFVHVSTDEVYGSIEEPYEADENYPLRTSSPYSSSKAGSDLLALSYYTTYKMNVSVTRASNNYGPFQFPEKLIPLMISNALEEKPLPIYGDGMQIRDWLYVDDHCRAIFAVLDRGQAGEIYNVGGSLALPNIEVVKRILKITGKSESLMKYVTDRPGHDRRYALNCDKLTAMTGWKPLLPFEQGLEETVNFYANNRDWLARVRSGEYRKYYEFDLPPALRTL